VYKNNTDHYKFTYPASWECASIPSPDKLLASLAGSEVVCASSDQRAAFAVVVHHHATGARQLHSTLTALVRDGVTVKGSIKYSTGSGGVEQATAAAIESGKHFTEIVTAVSGGPLTYYIASALQMGLTKQDYQDITVINNSLSFM
jgi:hypothetical protein